MLDKLEMFLALAREQHFGRAAQRLGVTQPGLSAGIKQLETQLGVQLVYRGSRFGGLTPEGAKVLIRAREIVDTVRVMQGEMREARQGLSGIVRLATIPTAQTLAADISTRFTAKHPDVNFTIKSNNASQIIDMIENLEIDAGITYLDDDRPGRIISAPIYRETYALVCASDSHFVGQSHINWADLADERLCLLTSDMQNRRIINGNFAKAGVLPAATVESNSTVVLLAHVETGRWVTILPQGLARYMSAGRHLTHIPMQMPEKTYTVGLMMLARDPQTPVMQAVLQAAQKMSEL